MIYRIEVKTKENFQDPRANTATADIRDAGFPQLEKAHYVCVYALGVDEESKESVQRIAQALLCDPVMEEYKIDENFFHPDEGRTIIEVAKKRGVMDPVAMTLGKAIRDLGMEAPPVQCIHQYVLDGNISGQSAQNIAQKILSNPAIEDAVIGRIEAGFPHPPRYEFKRIDILLRSMNKDELAMLSKERRLSLNPAEMQAIQNYFKAEGRDPSDLELEILAQTWSEHCKHKTLTGKIEYNGEIIDNLLKSTIKEATEKLNKPWCVSVFVDNSGIIQFDEDSCVTFKVETHNHPSAIEPYGGAGTGVGGVIRDTLGSGLGAKPILNTDVFCFARPDYPARQLPKGTIHPKRQMKGVVSGVRDYGNRMGIPTANGALYFDDRYLGNPLVYCGSVGLIPRDKCFGDAKSGDLVVALGGRTGRDGIGGATFSSAELDEKSETVSSGAVQIGNAITEKKLLDALLRARDANLYHAVTDCGAGGFSSAVGEMGERCGVRAHIDKAPLKYSGLSYAEIWLSEAQERMTFAVPAINLPALQEICDEEDVELSVLGEFTSSGRLELYYEGKRVADISMDFLHGGLPRITRKAEWKAPEKKNFNIPVDMNIGKTIHNLLAMPNVCSKEWVIRQYDHEVQGTSVLKPLQGIEGDGPGDACVLRPKLDSDKAIAVSNGMNPKYGDIDPYHMATSAIDEALRNLVAVGGNPNHTAILDNFSWGNTEKPDRLGAMVRACQGCHDAAVAMGTPFISGKDSLNNEYKTESGTICIPHTLLISAISVMDDCRKAQSMDFKAPGNLIYQIGLTKDETGGSHIAELCGSPGGQIPEVDFKTSKATFDALHLAIVKGLTQACHDLSEGGLAVALAESAFAGKVGASIQTLEIPTQMEHSPDALLLFSESNSRFIVEVKPDHRVEFENIMRKIPHAVIGKTTPEEELVILGDQNQEICREDLSALKKSWQSTLNW